MLAGLLSETDWGAPFETHFITKYCARLKRYEPLATSGNMQRLLRHICSERVVRQWWDLDTLDVREFCASLEEPTISCLIDTFCRLRKRKHSSLSWGDKTPHYVLNLEVLAPLFPESKFIIIVRDGRDVALSLLEKPWGPKNIAACAQYWVSCVQRRPVYTELEAAGRLVTIRYEDLLTHPESELERVLDCLNVTERRQDIISSVARIDRKNMNKWRSKMSSHQQAVFQQIAGDALVTQGYEVDANAPAVGSLQMAWYSVHQRIVHFAHLVYANTIEVFMIKFMGKQPFAD